MADRAATKTVELTHFGRKSGKPFRLTIWFVEMDGDLWIGTRDDRGNWPRNVAATGRAELDFGSGAEPYTCTAGTPEEVRRFKKAVRSKYPGPGHLIYTLLAIGKQPCCFRLRPEPPASA
jgi:hypothetical protein